MTTGERIKAARKAAGLTQKQLAKKIGIPYQSIGQWERGERNPKNETLLRIGNALGVNWGYLAGMSFGGESVEEAKRIHSDFMQWETVYAGVKTVIEALYGKREDVQVDGKYLTDVVPVYGNTVALEDDDFEVINNAVQAQVKALVDSLGTDASHTLEDLRRFNDSPEGKALRNRITLEEISVYMEEGGLSDDDLRSIFERLRFSEEDKAEFLEKHAKSLGLSIIDETPSEPTKKPTDDQ